MTKRSVAGPLKRRQSADHRPYRKMTITVAGNLADAVKDEVRAQRAPSTSAFISEAIEEKLERDQLREILDDFWREEPMTDEERAWADRVLGI